MIATIIAKLGLDALADALGITKLRVILGLVAIIGAGIVVTGAYVKGRMDQASNCKEAALEQKIASLERDLKVQKDADAVAYAEKLVLEMQNDEQQAAISAYEIELASRPNSSCSLTPDDVRRLHGGQR